MNRRDLLKAIIASPFAAAAGASLKSAPIMAPAPVVAAFKPLGDFTVFESLYRPPECTYRTSRSLAPEIGQEVSVERNGEVYFVGKVDQVTQSENGCEVRATGPQPEFTADDYRNVFGDLYGINAVNYPAL